MNQARAAQSAELFDRAPPSSPEDERAVLGSIVLLPSVFGDVASRLVPRDFHEEAHEAVYRAMLALEKAGRPLDMRTLIAQLQSAGTWELVGPDRLAEIAHAVPVAAHAMDYAEIVLDRSKRRRALAAAWNLIRDAHNATLAADETVARAEKALAGIESGDYRGEPVTVAAAIDSALEIAGRAKDGRGNGVLTGLHCIDSTIGGVFRGELVILAARPGIGKTALAVQIAEHVALHGKFVYFGSLEMSSAEIATRMLCRRGEVDSKRIRTATLEQEDYARLVEAANAAAKASMLIHDRAGLSCRDMQRAASRMTAHGLGLVVVDYLQRVGPENRRDQRNEQCEQIARDLKTLARDLNVAVLCLCQFNREADKEGRPQLRHLKESGGIEQEADVVMSLVQNVAWSATQPPKEWQSAIDILKHRNCSTPTLRLQWDAQFTRFSDPEIGTYHDEFAAFEGEDCPRGGREWAP